jgi:hypothetical protein
MLVVPKDLQTQYEKALDSASISRESKLRFSSGCDMFFDCICAMAQS